MAEFQEVMRQWQRMCKSMQEKNMSCKEDCLLGLNPTCGELEYASLEEINNAETVIMKWAAEHPEPVYPTWEEWLQSVGVMESSEGLLSRLQGQLLIDGIPAYAVPTSKVLQPMDADIAQKLGIEPKEDV